MREGVEYENVVPVVDNKYLICGNVLEVSKGWLRLRELNENGDVIRNSDGS